MEKNLITFLKDREYSIDSFDICLDGNSDNGEWISDTYDIEPFTEVLNIVREYKSQDIQLIDIQDGKGNIIKGFHPSSFIPKNGYMNKKFQDYLHSN